MFVVFDLETTGFSELNNDVIELAYIMFDDNNNFVKAEQLYFYYEGMSWSEEAYHVHHIPLEFLKTQKDKFKENLVKVYSVFNRANVCGHNSNKFDCPFLKTWLMRMGIRNLEFGVMQDTMLAYKPVTKKARIKLTKLIDYINISPDSINMLLPIWFEGCEESHAHEAAYDAVATALLALRGIEKRLISFEPLIGKPVTPNQIEVDGMFDEGKATKDPNSILVKLLDYNADDDEEHLYFTCSDHTKYAKVEPTESDVTTARKTNSYLPLLLKEVESRSACYVGELDGNKFKLEVNGKADKLSLVTSYGEFVEPDIDIKLIIANTFKEA